MNCHSFTQNMKIYYSLQGSGQYSAVRITYTHVPEARKRRAHFSEARFKPPKFAAKCIA